MTKIMQEIKDLAYLLDQSLSTDQLIAYHKRVRTVLSYRYTPAEDKNRLATRLVASKIAMKRRLRRSI